MIHREQAEADKSQSSQLWVYRYWTLIGREKNLHQTLNFYWWPGTESNRRRRPFQGRLPNRGSGLKSTDLVDYNEAYVTGALG